MIKMDTSGFFSEEGIQKTEELYERISARMEEEKKKMTPEPPENASQAVVDRWVQQNLPIGLRMREIELEGVRELIKIFPSK